MFPYVAIFNGFKKCRVQIKYSVCYFKVYISPFPENKFLSEDRLAVDVKVLTEQPEGFHAYLQLEEGWQTMASLSGMN